MIAAALDGALCGLCADRRMQTNLHVSRVYPDGAQLSGYLSQEISTITCIGMGRDSSVGIAIRYRLDCRGIEFRWGRVFPHSYRPALEPIQPPIQWEPGLSRG
jgi:hypothetical protein